MFHSSLIVYDKVRIIILIFCELSLKKSVHITVTAFSLSSSHYKKIKIIILNQCIFKTHFRIIRLGYSGRDRILFCKFCTGDFFTYIAKSCLYLYSKYFIEI